MAEACYAEKKERSMFCMKYFVVESVMNENLPVSPQQMEEIYVPAHVAHLHEGIDAGMVLLGGPCETGGFLLLRAESREKVDAFLAEDPFRINNFNRFVVKEFLPKDRADMVKDW